MGTRSCKDFIWSEEFVRNFLEWLNHTEELGLDKCVASKLELQSWRSSGISRGLVLTLSFGDVLPELLV